VNLRGEERNSVFITRWIARMWGTGIVALVALFAVMQLVSPDAPPPTPTEWVGVVFFPIGLCVGLVLAWRWEAFGGAVAIGSFVAFEAWMSTSGAGMPSGTYFIPAAAPGALFLLSWFLSRGGPRRPVHG
jgi:hypothetical protein